MSFNLKNHKDDLLFLPLGGAEEIGMNLNLYYYKGKWLMVDLGIGFADQYYSGIDVLVPNIDYIIKNKENLLGLVLTHAHEDHIGAVQYLWRELDCPIYATNFASSVLKTKFSENGVNHNNKIKEIKTNKRFKLGDFDIEMVGITHSIPEMNGLMIRTDKGNIFHTGDWKLDPNPLIGDTTDEKKLKALGKEGVLAVIGDSTNIFNEDISGSEGDLMKSLTDLISSCKKNMVVVTTFASNVARLYSIAKAAEECGRKVALAGRSLWRIYNAAQDCGYLKDLAPFIRDKEIGKHRRDKVLLIATGCQGEPLAAVSKFAHGTHPNVSLKKGDTIIFSSKIIPGNDKKIFYMFNKFCKLGIEVMTERDHFVHVSGHPSRSEIRKMYKLLNPKIVIPVHGEPIHLHEHAKFAIENGAEHAIEPYNGSAIKISEDGAKIVGEVNADLFAIDGNFILPSDSPIIKMRRKMRDNGVVVITALLSKGKLIKNPIVTAPGVLDPAEDQEYLDLISDRAAKAIKHSKGHDETSLQRAVRAEIRKTLKNEIGKESLIVIQIENTD